MKERVQLNGNTLNKTGTKIYGRAEKDKRELSGTTTPMVINQYILLLWWTNNDKEKQEFLQHKKKYKNTKSLHRWVEECSFAAVLTDITRRRVLPEKSSIHTAERTAMKIALKEIHKREDERRVIYIDSEFYAIHWIQQRKLSNIKSNIWHPSRTPK